MSLRRPLFLLACVVVVSVSEPACIQVPDIEPAQAQVRIVEPADTAYTHGVLEVRLEVTGHRADRVELLVDGKVLTELAPPYTYPWDTSELAEGAHRLEARAVLGEEAFGSEGREVVVDRTPPRVVSRTPEPGAEDVWVRGPIRAVFSEKVKADTVTGASVRLTVGTVEVARTVSLSEDGRTLTVEPGSGYVPSSAVSLALAAQVTDLAGNSVETLDGHWSWRLPYWIPWGTADGALVSSTFSAYPFAFTTSGTVLTTWRARSDPTRRTQLNHWTDGEWAEWDAQAPVNPGPTEGDAEPLLLDEAGRPVVAWTEAYGPSKTQIHVARWTGSDWEPLGTPTPQNTGMPQKYSPILAWTPSHQLALAWAESDNAQSRVCLSILSSPGWQPPGSCVGLTDSRIEGPMTLQVTPSGSPVVSWMDSNGVVAQVRIARFVDGNWLLIDEDQESNQLLPYVSMHLNASGNPIIAWTTESAGSIDLYIDEWNGMNWQNIAVSLNALADDTPILAHSLLTASDGEPLVAWSEQGTAGATHLYVRRWTGETWQSLNDESLPGTNSGVIPKSLHRLASGELILSWIEYSSGPASLHIRRFNE